MHPREPRDPARRRRPLVVLAVLLLVGAGLPSAPAAAHDVLLSTDPVDGAVLSQAPGQVVLTFSADQIPVGTAVQVLGPDGSEQAQGPPDVQGPLVTQTLSPDLVPGAYAVTWRSVSADGHALTGTFGFTLEPPAAPEPTPTATPTPTPTPTPSTPPAGPSATLSATAEPEDAREDESGAPASGPGWALAGGAAALAGVATLVVVLRRRRRR